MSTYSYEHHVRASQQAILEQMAVFFRAQACQSFEVASLSQDEHEREALVDALLRDYDHFVYVVSPTDTLGWTILWGDFYEYYQDQLVAFLSEQLQTTALYGHYNDYADNWHWILFENGKETTSYWYLGREAGIWWNAPEFPIPPAALGIEEAFEAQGRTYHHLNAYLAIYTDWSKNSLSLEQFRLVSVSDSADTTS